jgi:small-conductance mechanosensitive channel
LGRVINPESIGKERTQLIRAVVLALRELMHQTDTDERTRDLAAFIAITLDSIYQTIDVSVSAWEKRGYWIKADRFRMDWAWTEKFSKEIRNAVLVDDWASVALAAGQIAEKLRDVNVPQRNRIGTPWDGAWDRLK